MTGEDGVNACCMALAGVGPPIWGDELLTCSMPVGGDEYCRCRDWGLISRLMSCLGFSLHACRRRWVLWMGHSAAPVSARLCRQHRRQPLQAQLRPAAGLGHPDAHCIRPPAGEEVGSLYPPTVMRQTGEAKLCLALCHVPTARDAIGYRVGK